MAPLHRSTPPPPQPQPHRQVQSQSQPQAGQLQIQHFTHQHPVQKLFMAFEFVCDGCRTRGYGVRYRCSACNYDLHEHCATAPHSLSSHVHPHHQIVLVNRPDSSHFCDVCKGFTDGLSYTCQMCEFDVHTLCTQIPVATGVPQLTVDPCKQQGVASNWAQPTTAFGGHQGQPVMINQQQGLPTSTTAFSVHNGQPMVINQQQQGVPTMAVFGDYNGANNSKPVMMNNYQQYQQHQQGVPTMAFGGYQKVNNNQAVMMMNHQLQQQPLQQGIPMTTAYGGYQNQFGGYQNQPVMINRQQQQPQQQQQQGKSNNLANVGKIAANILMTSLIGVPLNFNSRK